MPIFTLWSRLVATCLLLAAAPAAVWAAPPHELLFPDTTQAFVSVEDVTRLRASWKQTQFAQMLADPVMQPFAEDLREQLRGRWSQLNVRLGLSLDDLEGVPSGELSLGVIQPAPDEAAVAILVDIAGHAQQAGALLAKIDRDLRAQKATVSKRMAYGAEVTLYTLPPREGERRPRTAVFFTHEDILGGSDSLAVAEGILGRFMGEPRDALARRAEFVAIMERAGKSLPELKPELRWFLNPFGYVETMRASELGQRERQGKDMLKILASQGFTAIQGVGGYVNFYVSERYDLLHRTFIYAPPVTGAAPGERYQLAARMLQFPNGGNLAPQPWVPRELATYVSFNWIVHEAFEYSATLVDAIVGEEGVFEDVIESIEQDPNGPQINLRRDLVAHLGTRVTVVSDYALPITPKSERLVFAIEAVDPAPLAATIEKTMRTDPDARRLNFGEHVIWEIVEAPEELPELPELQFDGFDPVGPANAEAEQKPRLPNAAVAVAHGHLFIATHVDFLKKILTEVDARETLAQSFDYRLVMEELGQLVQTENSLLAFSRTEEEYRPTYELIRTGRMPESKTMLGKLLNALFAEGPEGELRPQQIKGDKLPDFERVRRYFGPAGTAVVSEEDGWFALGILLNKEKL